MKLEDLVPPLELCKQIPEGEFEDSTMVYTMASETTYTVEFRAIHEGEIIAPAPTVEEILEELPGANMWYNAERGLWYMSYFVDGKHKVIEADTATAAALGLWLEVRK